MGDAMAQVLAVPPADKIYPKRIAFAWQQVCHGLSACLARMPFSSSSDAVSHELLVCARGALRRACWVCLAREALMADGVCYSSATWYVALQYQPATLETRDLLFLRCTGSESGTE